jgi:signal transduction histidine kinase
MNLSLRTKGILALTALILYIALVGWFVTQARQQLYGIVQQMENDYATRELLSVVSNTLSHTLVETQEILSSAAYQQDHGAGAQVRFSGDMEALLQGLDRAQEAYPLLHPEIATFKRSIGGAPLGRNGAALDLADVRNSEQNLLAKLNDVLSALQVRSEEMAQSYHNTQQSINVFVIGANVLGGAASVVFILVFFTRLTKDIKRLQDRAVAVVAGYAGAPLINNRRDEIGGLIDAVNRMQVDLRRWESQQELTREQRFHQEKMAAVGSLAGAIGHEVNNPIAAISGVAQYMIECTKEEASEIACTCHDFAVQILEQTERIAVIMRDMATLTTPHSREPELLDLNALIQSTCSFIRFDKRFHDIAFEQSLDRSLPAVMAVADHLTQVLMNLLINAADAMDRTVNPRISIATSLSGNEIKLVVADNGCGMTPEVLAKAFEESFTTKPAGRGRGIGLFLCKTLIEKAGGRIVLASTINGGTTASLYLPLQATQLAAA